VGVPVTAHGSDFLQAVIGKLKTLPSDEPDRCGRQPANFTGRLLLMARPNLPCSRFKPGELP
jgi:hypothetical protein